MTLNPAQEIWILIDSRRIGGIESHVFNLVCGLKEQKLLPRVIFLQNYGTHPLFQQLKDADIPFDCLDGHIRTLAKHIKLHHPQLLHTHGYKASILGKMIGKCLKIPVISTYHAGEPGSGKIKLYNWFDYRLKSLSTNIAVSKDIANRLNGNVTAIPNFVTLPNQPPSLKSAQKKIVAFVGRLCYEKGADTFCQLQAILPDIQFEVFGEGPMQQELEEQYGDKIKFHGVVDSMEPHWDRIHLLCIPSRYEGLPLVALEAMAHGVPIAAFAVGGLRQLIFHEKNSYICGANTVNLLAEEIKKYFALSKDQAKQLIQNAQSTIRENYSAAVVTPKVIKVYEGKLK